MKITCIALDLDGTTLRKNGELSEKTKEALEAAMEAGIEVVVASGRSLGSLPEAIFQMEGIHYAITSNGAAVYELHTGRCLREFQMKQVAVEQILEETKEEDVTYETFIHGQPFAEKAYVEDPVRFGAREAAIPYIQRTRKPVEGMRAFIEAHKMELDCIDLVVKAEEEKMRLWRELKEKVPGIYLTSSVQQLLEIADESSGKDSGIAFVLEYLGLKKEELAAFGDADNDIDLLRYAAFGVAMENASEGCKAVADAITKTNEEDGVALGIQKILSEMTS